MEIPEWFRAPDSKETEEELRARWARGCAAKAEHARRREQCDLRARQRVQARSVEPFLRARCVEGEVLRAGATLLHQDYCDWAEQNGQEPMSARGFGFALRLAGFGKVKTMGRIVYVGLKLRSCSHGAEGTGQSEAGE